MIAFSKVQTGDRLINQLQQNIALAINPIIKNALTDGLILTNVILVSGTTTINHGLGRTLQGWIPVRWQGAYAQVYDAQNTNPSPQSTLILVSNAAVTVNLYVF